MIESAVTKLTFAYLAIIMFLSISFSLYLYHISDRELSYGLRRPTQTVFRETSLYGFDEFRNDRLQESRNKLKQRLIVLNLATLIVGFAISYALARKTLEPIDKTLEAQKRFTADASHELKTPLTAMQTEIEVTLRDKNLTKDDAVELLKSNLEEVGKLKNLSDSLLTLAKQDGKDMQMSPVEINKSVNEAMKRVSKYAKQNKVKLNSSVGEAKIIGNQDSLSELFAILLDNAIKYSEQNSEVLITSKISAKRIFIYVSDKGVGINPKDLPFIFERFYRADKSRTKNKKSGYGIGLSIAKNIVTKHNGSIKVNSKVGKGTKFEVSFNIS